MQDVNSRHDWFRITVKLSIWQVAGWPSTEFLNLKKKIMPTAAGVFPRVAGQRSNPEEKIASQRSKENVCDDDLRRKHALSSMPKGRAKHSLGTPFKSLSEESVLRCSDAESALRPSYRTPNRTDSAQPKRRSARQKQEEISSLGGAASIKKAIPFLDATSSNIYSCTDSAQIAEELNSLRKEKSSLEFQNCNLEINFQTVKSQLEAVLLYKEVTQENFTT